MVTHELTVFPDGRIDGAFSVREGDYNSHILRFVLTQDLTATSAKLLLWPADEDKPTVYGTLLGRGQASGQDVQFTPVSWGKAPSQTQIQLELLDNNGNIIWQSRRLGIPVEPGVPDDAKREPINTSDATAGPGDVRLGKTFYARGEKKTGAYVTDGIHPRAWDKLPIKYIKGKSSSGGDDLYFQRVDSTEFMLVFPPSYAVNSVDVTLAAGDNAVTIYRQGVRIGSVSAKSTLVLSNLDLSQPISLGLQWGGKEVTISIIAKAENAEYACLDLQSVTWQVANTALNVTKASPTVETREGEVFYFFQNANSAGTDFYNASARLTRYSGCTHSRLAINGRVQAETSNLVIYFKAQTYALFELVSPDGKYRKKYCVCWRDPAASSASMEIYTQPAKALALGDTAFYDYAGAGFSPIFSAFTAEAVVSDVDILDYEICPYRSTDGRILLGSGVLYPMDLTAANINVLSTMLQDASVAGGNTLSFDEDGGLYVWGFVAYFGPETLTKGSRWIAFADDQLIDMPCFFDYVWPSNGMTLSLFYTCADGLDIGYPYMGA